MHERSGRHPVRFCPAAPMTIGCSGQNFEIGVGRLALAEADPVPDQPDVLTPTLPEQIRVRQEKRARLLAEGREPYPVRVPRTHALREVRERWGHLETGEETEDVVGVAGRVVFIRNTGKLCFATLQEGLTLERLRDPAAGDAVAGRGGRGRRWPPGRPTSTSATSSSSAAG